MKQLHNIKKREAQPTQGQSKSKYDREKIKAELKASEPTRLQIYEKLEQYYSDLRDLDVEYTLNHDHWKKKIDDHARDKQRVQKFNKEHEKEEKLKVKERIKKNLERCFNLQTRELREELDKAF